MSSKLQNLWKWRRIDAFMGTRLLRCVRITDAFGDAGNTWTRVLTRTSYLPSAPGRASALPFFWPIVARWRRSTPNGSAVGRWTFPRSGKKIPDQVGNDGIFYEYESYKRPFRSKKISHMIKRGFEQSNRIVIDNNKGASDRFIINGVYNRINDKAFKHEIMELLLYEKGRVRTLYKRKSGRELGSPRSTNP